VVYNAPKPIKKIFNDDDLYTADLFSFGSKIGQITNKSTCIYTMLNRFEKGSREYEVLMNRLKMITKLQSAEIDKSKLGREVKGIPKHWMEKNMKQGEEDFYNSIMLDKHPYFFKYLYVDTNKKYKKYIEVFENKLKNKTGFDLETFLNKKQYNETEKELLDNYYEYMPVLNDDSVMNKICRHIESLKIEITSRIKALYGKEMYHLLMHSNEDPKKHKSLYKKVLNIYNEINKMKYDKMIFKVADEDRVQIFKSKIEDLGNIYQAVDCLIYIMYVDFPNKNKSMLWDCFGYVILENLLDKFEGKMTMPVKFEYGEIEYLNSRYTMKEVYVGD
jgi:hypothetical protein